MPNPQTGSDTFDATVDLLFDGEDYTYTTFQLGEILKLLNRTTWLKNRVDVVYTAAHTWALLQTFTSGAQFDGPVTFNGALATRNNRHATRANDDETVDCTTADIHRVPSTLASATIYTFKVTAPVPPTGYTCRYYRTKTASAHAVSFVEQTSTRVLGGWITTVPAWSDFTWDGTKWHMTAWGAQATDIINDTSDP